MSQLPTLTITFTSSRCFALFFILNYTFYRAFLINRSHAEWAEIVYCKENYRIQRTGWRRLQSPGRCETSRPLFFIARNLNAFLMLRDDTRRTSAPPASLHAPYNFPTWNFTTVLSLDCLKKLGTFSRILRDPWRCYVSSADVIIKSDLN